MTYSHFDCRDVVDVIDERGYFGQKHAKTNGHTKPGEGEDQHGPRSGNLQPGNLENDVIQGMRTQTM